MNKILTTLLFLLLATPSYAEKCQITPHFSPVESIETVFTNELRKARRIVHMAAYGISNADVVYELMDLHTKGIQVTVTVDKSQAASPSSLVYMLEEAGIPVTIKKSNTLLHNKYVVIDPLSDNAKVIMGSWNFSRSADRQDNSAVVIEKCPNTVMQFEKDFQRMLMRDSQ